MRIISIELDDGSTPASIASAIVGLLNGMGVEHDAPAPLPVTAASTAKTAATGAATVSRRRAAPTAGAAPAATPATASAAPAEPVSRRRKGAAAEPAANPTSSATTAPAAEPAPTGRRRSASAGNVASTSEPGITDLDLMKAASDAAQKITPAVVKQIILEDFGVQTVNDVPQERRREFLDTLKQECAP